MITTLLNTITHTRSLKTRAMYLLALLGLGLCVSFPAAAAEIKYQVLGYGDSHALIILSGDLQNEVTTNLSSDGLSVRISAPGAVFVPHGAGARPTLISHIQQVRRGIYTDLVLNLVSPSNLTASPGSATTRLFIQSRSFGAAPQPDVTPTKERKPPLTNIDKVPRYIPLQIVLGDTKLLSKPFAAALVLPSPVGLKPTTGLTQILRTIAYGLDFMWAWMSGRPLEYMPGAQCHDKGKEEEIKQMEALIKDLTEELMRIHGLRKSIQPQSSK